MSSFQSSILRVFWSPVYEWFTYRFLKFRSRRISFSSYLDNCKTILYVVGPETEMLEKALRDIDIVKVNRDTVDFYVLAHDANKSHLDSKLFPHLIFYSDGDHYTDKSVSKKLQQIYSASPDAIICRISELNPLLKMVIARVASPFRLFIGEGDFSTYGTFRIADSSVQVDTILSSFKSPIVH